MGSETELEMVGAPRVPGSCWWSFCRIGLFIPSLCHQDKLSKTWRGRKGGACPGEVTPTLSLRG